MQAVLFDLDGTLLDVSMDAFLNRYFSALRVTVAPRYPGIDLVEAVLDATRTMQRPHAGTNREAFYRRFQARTGIDLTEDWRVFEDFYRDIFPRLGEGYGPNPGAREAIEAARSLGLKVAVATQPIFPRAAIEHRLAWAGLQDVEFDAVTTFEVMESCKPSPDYFRQVAWMVGCDPAECLMVGDDRDADMPAAAVGMRTFYVGTDAKTPADHRGTLLDLPGVLDRLAGPDGA
jgi:HAD superfamily hydrolase (TIGR01509 family)